jgi:FkbM family methyltransferase
MFRLRRINALRWLWRIPVTVPVKSDPPGYTLYVDLLRNFRIVCSGVQAIESDERKSFDRLIDRFRPRVFWDVGSNVGIYALQFLARVPQGSVAAFEPDRRNIELLMRTAQKNNFKSVTVVPRAVGESSGEAEFFLDDITGATGTINPAQLFIATQYGQVPNKTMVAVTTLDDELQARAGPDIIKIDVEGAELAAMTGGRRMFAQCKPAVIYEASRRNFARTRPFMESLGYRLFDATTLQPIAGPVNNVIALHEDKHLSASAFLG